MGLEPLPAPFSRVRVLHATFAVGPHRRARPSLPCCDRRHGPLIVHRGVDRSLCGLSVMPAHKYYCDYCDKQFYDTPASRKRHLQGISHQRAKKQWFDSFRDQESRSTQDGNRPPCTFYLRTGTCQYGSECTFEHPARNPAPSAPAPPFEALNAPELYLANFLMKDLPFSLRPPPEGGYPSVAPVEWG